MIDAEVGSRAKTYCLVERAELVTLSVVQRVAVCVARDRSFRLFPLSFHLIAKRDHAVLVGLHLGQMKGNIAVKLLEEGNPLPD